MDQYCTNFSTIPTESLSLESIIQAPWDNYTDPITPRTALHLLQSLFVLEASFLDGASVLETLCQCIFCWELGWSHFNS